MSTAIIGRIDEMGNRIDDLEKSIGDLMQQVGYNSLFHPSESTIFTIHWCIFRLVLIQRALWTRSRNESLV